MFDTYNRWLAYQVGQLAKHGVPIPLDLWCECAAAGLDAEAIYDSALHGLGLLELDGEDPSETEEDDEGDERWRRR